MTNAIYAVDFDGAGLTETFTIEEMFFDPDADYFLTREEVEAIAIGESLTFGGGASGIGTITRLS